MFFSDTNLMLFFHLVTLLQLLANVDSLQSTTATVLEITNSLAVGGHRAFLPCDLTPPSPSEHVYLVLWYRGFEGEPLYSYDARHGAWNLGARWSDQNQFGDRAYFQLGSRPAELRIENILATEAGLYRCRVDFKSAPTRNSLVNLTVIEPPRAVNIIDSRGQELRTVAGPHAPGARIVLRCLSTGGNPAPEVTWYRGSQPLDTSYDRTFSGVIQNTLELGPLHRSDLGASLTCSASNNNISAPLTTSVQLDMVFPPVDVSIVSLEEPLSADSKYLVECEAAGSRPEPVMTWWLGDTFLPTTDQVTHRVGNITKSVLSFVPTHKEDQRMLTCRAENTKVADGALQDSVKLTVHYPPIVKLRLGLELGTDTIEEGKDVYFECKIKANPDVYKITWTHNGKRIEEKSSSEGSGLIMSGKSLVLQGVKRQQAGNYTCIVSNLEGDVESNSALLQILYAPRCVGEEKQTFGANIGSTVSIKCSVDSYPAPTSFSWGFNNSKDAVKINEGLYEWQGSQSLLHYRTLSDHQFGHLYCWARNSMGVMRQPCIFTIIPATVPQSPGNCAVLNQTTDVLQVKCEPGFDGGLDQGFMLEVIDVMSGIMLANVSSHRPVFIITGLNPGRDLRLLVFSFNKNGRSKPTVLEGFSTKVAQLQVGPGSSGLEHSTELGAEQNTIYRGEQEHSSNDLALISGQQQQSLWIRTKPVSSSSATAGHLTLTVNSNESPPLAPSSWTPLLHNLSTESIL